MDVTSEVAHPADALEVPRPRFLSPNPSKRAAERYYFIFFLVTVPIQLLVLRSLSFAPGTSNDALLVTQGVILGVGAWGGSVIFRAPQDKGIPFFEVYGFKIGCFLAIWAMVGGYLGTDAWYEVLHGHFGFNTHLNPNGVPLFMLPMTIAVFGFYTVVLCALYRLGWHFYERRINHRIIPPIVARVMLILPLSVLMPLVETYLYTNPSYCFDDGTGKWFLNLLIYGAWQGAALLFTPGFDEAPGTNQPVSHYVVRGFAVVGIVLLSMQLTTEVIAPHFTTVVPGAQYVNDWSPNNCLGLRPGSNH